MNPTKLIAIVLIVAGRLGLAYGGFSYTKETTGRSWALLNSRFRKRKM